MTHSQRNAAISKKIAAYTVKFTASKGAAKEALNREGFGAVSSKTLKKQNVAA